jgi:hypothetical protein
MSFVVQQFREGDIGKIARLLMVSPEARIIVGGNQQYKKMLMRQTHLEGILGTPIGMQTAYVFVGNAPVVNYDPEGDVGQIVGGALVGCAAGASFSLVTSWLAGDNACQCTCKAFGACGVGAAAGALATANPALSGCLAGLAGSTISTLVSQGCDSLCGKSDPQKPICVVASILITTIAGCAVPEGALAPTQQYVLQLVGEIVGFDIAGYCNMVATW